MCPGSLDDETPCESCGLELLEDAVQRTRAGQLVRAALDLDFTRAAGITIGPDDVSCEEFRVLKMISGERERYSAEQREAARREQEAQQRKGR